MIPLPQGIRLASFSEVSLMELWLKVKPFDVMFSDQDVKDPEVFLKLFLAPDSITFWIEDGGFVLLKNIQRGYKAEFHACLWDKRLSPRTELLTSLMGWIFMEFNLTRLESYVACYAKAVLRFLTKKMGFKVEGVMRQAWLHKGQLQDIITLSILKNEVKL